MARSRTEQSIDVLGAIDDGRHKPTRIMYAANLSWSCLQEIFDTLKEKRCIRTILKGKATRYYLTDTGEVVLKRCKGVSEIFVRS